MRTHDHSHSEKQDEPGYLNAPGDEGGQQRAGQEATGGEDELRVCHR